MYTRVRDCFNRPICSVPGGEIDLLDRESDDCNWTFRFETPKFINAVRSIAPKPFPILDQNMWFCIPYFEPYPAGQKSYPLFSRKWNSLYPISACLLFTHYSNFCSFLSPRHPGTKTKALNLASYNYLGFAENSGPCAEAAEQAVRRYGVAGCSARNEYGKPELINSVTKFGIPVSHISVDFEQLVFSFRDI